MKNSRQQERRIRSSKMKDWFPYALCLGMSVSANAYETGSLTCETIGDLAARTLVAKQSGTSDSTHLASLNQLVPANAGIERNLLANIVRVIYRNNLLVAMKPADAYAVFMVDCMRGKGQDPEDRVEVRDTEGH